MSSSTSRVSISRSLVGSSSTKRFDGLASACASIRRPRSPPDSLPAGQRFGEGDLRVEAVAVLIERSDRQIGAEPYRARIRRQDAGQHFDQRGLAAAVRANDADAVAALDADREIADDRAADIDRKSNTSEL